MGHSDHRCQTVEKMASEHRKMLMGVVAPLATISDNLLKAKDTINSTKANVQAQGSEIKFRIDKRYAEQLAELNQSYQQLKEKVQAAVLRKETALTAQLEKIGLAHDKVTELQKSIVGSSNHQILMETKHETENQVKKVTESYGELNLQPIELDTMSFYPSNTPFTLLGKLYTDTNPSEIMLPKYIFQNKAVQFKISTKRDDRQYRNEGDDLVSVELKSSTGSTTVGAVRDVGDGSYMASFVAEQIGEAKLVVSINGQQIKGSPFILKVTNNYYEAIDKPTKTIENKKMGQCWGVAFGKKGVWGV